MRTWLPPLALLFLALVSACGGGGGASSDEKAIRDLTALLHDTVKAEKWGEVYDLMSSGFKARCTRDDFVSGITGAIPPEAQEQFRESLRSVRLVDVEQIQISGTTAHASVLTEDFEGRKRNTIYYAREEGTWRVAPDPDTEGCTTESGPPPGGTSTPTPAG